jgi:nucleotide-binding universal stress UspA family protein
MVMALKDIFVHVDATKGNAQRIGAAIDLAVKHEAQLTGVYAISRPVIPAYAEVQISEEVLVAQANALKETADKAKVNFQKDTEAKGLKAGWSCYEGITDVILNREARTADILVVGQHDPDEDVFPGGRDMPDQVILSSGRPVLLIPYTYDGEEMGKRILVAWDGSSRATRAVHDAMPILQAADQVTVMVANPEGETRIGQEPGAQIATHLVRHGVKAEAAHITNTDVKSGELLLSRAADMSADMIVCGAYGHARWKELILGGVTDHLLEHMPVPILMSH